jgi:hypothetical protein
MSRIKHLTAAALALGLAAIATLTGVLPSHAQPVLTPPSPQALASPVTIESPGNLNLYGTADHTRSVCFYSCATWAEEIHTINSAVIGLYSHNNIQGSKVPLIYLARSNGTEAAPTAVTYTGYEQNPLGGLQVSGYDGSVYSNPGGGGGAMLNCYTDENWTPTAHGSHCSIYATIVGAAAAVEFMAFGGKDPAGNGSGIKIITYRPIAFNAIDNSHPMLDKTASALGLKSVLSDSSGPSFFQASYFQTGDDTTVAGAQKGDLVLAKETDAAAAPGAGFCVLKAVAGTNAGTGKLIARCGTSTTPVTVTDNIGSGF